jgi:RHH-type proline utilization regulon transcriptional repressor/proline dehydrogenase/delta 1-pyrroline-5-carboxylate dehydrogenase
MPDISSVPKRTQNRAESNILLQEQFHNAANTDWNLKANRDWLQKTKDRWTKPEEVLPEIRVIADLTDRNRNKIKLDNWNGITGWSYELATEDDYREFLNQPSDWHLKPAAERAELLRAAAVELEKKRGDLIAVSVIELGKTIAEADVEVSEAVDFANFYAQCILNYETEISTKSNAGVNLILSPWNFPVAIPIGGVLASLAAGKRVILKPSTNAAATAYLTSQCLFNAGIPKSAFAFLPAEEKSLDPLLSNGKIFDAVILTGGTETARFFLERNPEMPLFAETGGKNSTIVTTLSDREQAIKNVVWSAFGNAGQKCSATSLLILEKEVFCDDHFKSLLKDAVSSKINGNPWNFETQIGPLAVPVSEKLKRVIEETPDNKWLVKPQLAGDFFLSPGIIWGLEITDYAYNNELFGPILGVMKAENLEEAVNLANGVEYGLTSGLESLDTDDIRYWKDTIKAGNLYVNRATTGAVVQRQPFGGIKASSFGFGMKAGGQNYVLQFMEPETEPRSFEETQDSYRKWARKHFEKETDDVNLRGQDNQNRYLKPDIVYILIDELVSDKDTDLSIAACKILKIDHKVITLHDYAVNRAHVYRIRDWNDLLIQLDYTAKVRTLNLKRLPESFVRGCHQKGLHLYGNPVSSNGRIELLNYLDEQNFSYNYHRYGNLMGRKSSE